MNKNEEFDVKTSEKQKLEKLRQDQHITPLLNSTKRNWSYFAKHTRPQVEMKCDGMIEGPIFFENKCLSQDFPMAYFEMSIDRGTHIEEGWATRETHCIIKKYPFLLINAYETYLKIYDMHEAKRFISTLDRHTLRELGGRQTITWDSDFGGYVTGWLLPFFVLESYEYKL